MTAYTACITSCSKNRHFYVPRPSFFVYPGSPLWQSRKTLHEWKDNSVLAKPLAACTHLSLTVSQSFEPQVQKIAVFTYHNPHFCFPWRRPCDYHAMCCMDGTTIQSLPNPSKHVPIYLQQFPSYTMLKSMHKSKNRYFYHVFVSPGDAPEAIMLNVVSTEKNSMLTNCLAACAHLTITVSETERDIGQKSSFFSYPPCIWCPR